MSDAIAIETNWLPPFHGAKEIRQTSAEIRISLGRIIATRHEDDWSQTVQEKVRVPAYPLALWFASSWWRLRWESRQTDDIDWRMSHELPAVGLGYLWPQLTFRSDGESVSITCRPSNPLSGEPIRYLSDTVATVSAADFELAVDDFVNLVCRRLDPAITDLHRIWRDVLSERTDPNETAARKLEAGLGYDPDDAPPSLVEDFLKLALANGPKAADEIVPVCAGENPARALEQILEFAASPGIHGNVNIPRLTEQWRSSPLPWQQGKSLASLARKALGLHTDRIDDVILCDLLEIPTSALSHMAGNKPDIGLAVRTDSAHRMKFLFRKRNLFGRRFETARLVGDFLSSVAPNTPGRDINPVEAWFPVTDTMTARQKFQRAFATEFLCPIDALRDFLHGRFTEESFEEASEHFGISEHAITSHLRNNHLMPRSIAADSDYSA